MIIGLAVAGGLLYLAGRNQFGMGTRAPGGIQNAAFTGALPYYGRGGGIIPANFYGTPAGAGAAATPYQGLISAGAGAAGGLISSLLNQRGGGGGYQTAAYTGTTPAAATAYTGTPYAGGGLQNVAYTGNTGAYSPAAFTAATPPANTQAVTAAI